MCKNLAKLVCRRSNLKSDNEVYIQSYTLKSFSVNLLFLYITILQIKWANKEYFYVFKIFWGLRLRPWIN